MQFITLVVCPIIRLYNGPLRQITYGKVFKRKDPKIKYFFLDMGMVIDWMGKVTCYQRWFKFS